MAVTPEHRAEILDTALRLMAERGYGGMSMRDLSAASGLNIAIIYRNFENKEAILSAVVDERRVRVFDGPAPVKRGATDEATLTQLISTLLNRDLEYEQIYRIMFGLDARDHPRVVELRTELWGAIEQAYKRWLVELFPHLKNRKDLNAIARTLRTVVQGAYGELVLSTGDRNRARRARAKELAAVLAPAVKKRNR